MLTGIRQFYLLILLIHEINHSHLPSTPALQNRSLLTLLKYMAVFLPVVIYFIAVNNYAVNIPSQDDYDAILNFLCAWKNAHGIDKFYLLFLQQSEHRILSSRIIYVVYDSIMGNINFRSLIFIGNIQLLLTFLIFISFIKKCLPRHWVLASFVAGLCFFDLNNWENADFAMASMQNYGVVFLFSASMFFYSRKGKWNLFAGLLFQAICTYSSGNGIVASALLAAFNILNGNRIHMYASSLAFIIFSPLYFLHYIPVHEDHRIPAVATMITYFFRFASNHIYYGNNTLSAIAGVAILLILAFLLPVNKKLQPKEDTVPLVCLLGFVIVSMILASVFRAGFGDYIPSRYLVYPHLLIAILFVFLLIRFKDKKIITPLAVLFTVIVLIAYNMNCRSGLKGFAKLKETLKSTDYYYPRKDAAKQAAEQSCRLKIYCIEQNR